MRYLYLTPLACLAALQLAAQSIVPNGSFETYSSCPTAAMQINRATGWYSACQTPDYFNACGASMVSVPTNWCGTQSARTGVAYGRVLDYGYATDYREYMQIQLSSPMTAGASYTVQYYVNLNDNASIAHNGPEAYFSTTAISTGTLFTFTPHVAHPSVITDKAGWTLISGTYLAAGGEQYLTLGQYGNDASVPTASVAGGVWASASYYIEDVTVVPVVLETEFGGFTAVALQDHNHVSVELGTPHTGTVTLQRSTDGQTWSDFLTQEVQDAQSLSWNDDAPAAITWYRARREDAQGEVSLSEVREVRRLLSEGSGLVVYPNPSSAELGFTLEIPADVTWKDAGIYSLSGQKVLSLNQMSQSSSSLEVATSALAPGLYLAQVITSNGNLLVTRVDIR